MEDPRRVPARPLRVTRGAEENRLARQALPAAYQRVLPILRRTPAGSRAATDSDVSNPLPRRAAGA
jgi:hypothetical protein